MPEFSEGVGELWEGDRPLGRVRFRLDYPPPDRVPAGPGLGTIKGMSDPPSGYVEPVDAVDLRNLYRCHSDLVLRFEDYSMPCILHSAEGRLGGMGGWSKRKVTFAGPAACRPTVEGFSRQAVAAAKAAVKGCAATVDGTGEHVTLAVEYEDGSRREVQVLYADLASRTVVPKGFL